MSEMVTEWLDEISIEDIPQNYQPLAKAIGIKALMLLAQEVGGTTLYVPKAESLVQEVRDRKIRAEFNGSNYRELARKYNLSESWVRRIVREEASREGQMSLFNTGL